MTAAMTRFRSYRIRIRRNAVNTSRIAMKMTGFAIDSGSSNATMPDAWTGTESRTAPISTARSRRGIARNGRRFLVSKAHLRQVVRLISVLSLSKNMDIREYLVDILLTVVMIISSLVLITRFWQDLIIAVAAGLMTLALGGLLLSLNFKMRHLERSVVIRERMLRTNLEEISARMQDKYDMALSHLDELIGEFSRRAYR